MDKRDELEMDVTHGPVGSFVVGTQKGIKVQVNYEWIVTISFIPQMV